MTITNFSAQEPSLGYYYQIRLSLYLLLCCKDKPESITKLENLDDITIEDIDTTNLFQTKLHINSIANLSDRSSDFWKTIRIWSESISNGLVDLENVLFTLITTASISESSFIYNFSSSNPKPDLDDTLNKMKEICLEVSNKENKAGYSTFSNLSEEQQKKLLKNIKIIDSSLSIQDTLNAVKNELRLSAPVGKVDLFVEYIEGWWFQKCIEILSSEKEYISMRELNQIISDRRDTFQADNLPDDFADPFNINEDELQSYEERIFIKQLKLIAAKSSVLRNAISDFRRAYEQRSKWLREELTNIEEFEYFEKQLFDYWKNIFDIVKDECDGLCENELSRIGYDFYKRYYVENTPPYKIREKFQSLYLTRGSCHMLADEKRIGWHPNFDTLIEK